MCDVVCSGVVWYVQQMAAKLFSPLIVLTQAMLKHDGTGDSLLNEVLN